MNSAAFRTWSSARTSADKGFRSEAGPDRRLWRALSLVIRAKLEAIESGISTFDREFLADIVTKDGRTIGEAILPRLSEAVASGRLLPAKGE